MLVVDRHALVAVHLLHLVHEVLLGGSHALDLEQFLGIPGTLDDGVAGPDLLPVGDLKTGARRDRVGILVTVVSDDEDLAATAVVLTDPDYAGGTSQRGLALRGASLEEFDHTGQTAGDVLRTSHATGVEGPHRELGTRLTDRLGSDDANRFAELDVAAGGERHAVARRGDAERGVVGQR